MVQSSSLKNKDYNFTNHGFYRIKQRNISYEEVKFAIDNGKRIYKQGCIFYIVLNKYLPKNSRAKNLIVICESNNNTVITAYKNEEALKKTKKLCEINFKKRKTYEKYI